MVLQTATVPLAFVKPFLSDFAKKYTIQLVTAVIPHLHEPSHETKRVLTQFLTRHFNNKPREYNKLVWEYIDERTPQLTKRQNDIIYELVFGIEIPWVGLDYTGDIRMFEFPWNAAGKCQKRHRRGMRKKLESASFPSKIRGVPGGSLTGEKFLRDEAHS